MFIFLMEMMTSYFIDVSLVPSLQLSISLSMDYLALLNHHEPENFVGCCQRNMVGSLPRGMPKVVDCRQIDAQAMN